MDEIQIRRLCRSLDVRRRQLRMGYAVVAKKSGISMPNVVRILGGKKPRTRLEYVLAIAEVLGMAVTIEPTVGVSDFRERQAREKAKRLVGMVQGTSGLESQALNDEALEEMIRETVHELLAGSPRKLWSE